MLVFINLKIKSPNAWGASAKYENMNRQRQRKKVLAELRLRGRPPKEFSKVILTRHGRRALDSHDNLRSAFKGIADAVQDYLGVNDRDIVFEYGQKSGQENRWRGRPKPAGVEIEIAMSGS